MANINDSIVSFTCDECLKKEKKRYVKPEAGN